MLRVVSIVDKKGTALDRLARGVAQYHNNLEYFVCDVHPKRPSPEQLAYFEECARSADIIDFQYFRSALRLLELYPDLRGKKLVLTHNNGYSHLEGDWSAFTALCAANTTIKSDLEAAGYDATHIPLAADATFWDYRPEWELKPRVLMVANRIESKKGILPVALACRELGLTFVLVGNISDSGYFHEVARTGSVEFHENVSDEKLRELYYGAGVHVCNSFDDFESGTLPMLEAMLCGTPVLTRRVGHVDDLYNGENLRLLDGQPDDTGGLTAALSAMYEDPKALQAQRSSAWNTAKNFNFERRAWMYQRLYRSLYPGTPVSVIVPVCDRPEVMRKTLNAIAEQDYPNIELIVVDDSDGSPAMGVPIMQFADTVSFPVRYLYSGQGDYGLARARNLGIIEATGDVLVFCDERMVMAPDAVSVFTQAIAPNLWLYGDKDTPKKDMVENFSCIRRQDVIKFGMFNERINRYGGMSQEIRSRMKLQGLQSRYIPEAKAVQGAKSSNRNRKRQDIIAMKNLLFKVGL